MSRLKIQIIWDILLIATWAESLVAYRVNTTIFDTNSAHITYHDLKSWKSGVYRSQGKTWTSHSSLNNQLASMVIEFQGTDVWVYGPPLSQLTELPPNYKICLNENNSSSPKHQCYHINITEAYLTSGDGDEPIAVFSQGGLSNTLHRILVSVADPADDLQVYNGIKFSHAIYTTERPTRWPVKEDRWRYREVVMHNTHPLLSYYPRRLLWFSPWTAKTHASEDGVVMSWHQLHEDWFGALVGVEAKLKGIDFNPIHHDAKVLTDSQLYRLAGAIAIYGAPSAYIEKPNSLGLVCVQLDSGSCEVVDLKTIYSNQKDPVRYEPVLLWRNDTLDPSRQTLVSIRLVKSTTGTRATFPFKSINFFEEKLKEYSGYGPLVTDLENVTVKHDNVAVHYNPGRSCDGHNIFGECNSWFDPWTWREVGPLGSVLTYRSSISRYRVTEDPHVSLRFQGSAIYLYGAPDAYASRPFAPQHVCLNNACRVIDLEQAYLNPPRRDMETAGISKGRQNTTTQETTTSMSIPRPELEPVLIWSATGLDYKFEHTLRLALASLPAPDKAEMTIVKFVYTKVPFSAGRPDPPVPGPDRAGAGPLYPPYATKWVPLGHKPPPPIPTDTSPRELPLLSPSIIITAASIVLLAFFYILLRILSGHNPDEAQPLLPGPAPTQPSGSSNAMDPPPDYNSIMPGRSDRPLR